MKTDAIVRSCPGCSFFFDRRSCQVDEESPGGVEALEVGDAIDAQTRQLSFLYSSVQELAECWECAQDSRVRLITSLEVEVRMFRP